MQSVTFRYEDVAPTQHISMYKQHNMHVKENG